MMGLGKPVTGPFKNSNFCYQFVRFLGVYWNHHQFVDHCRWSFLLRSNGVDFLFLSIRSSSAVNPVIKKKRCAEILLGKCHPGWPSSFLKFWIFNHWLLAGLGWCLSLIRSRIPLYIYLGIPFLSFNQPRPPSKTRKKVCFKKVVSLWLPFFWANKQETQGIIVLPSQTLNY